MECIRSVVNFPSRFYACFFRRHNETITFTTHVYNSAFRCHAFTSLKRILFILRIKQVATTLIFSFERSFFFRRRKSFLFCLFPYDATMVGGTMIGSNSFSFSGSLKRNNAGIYIERLLVRSRPYVSLLRFKPIYFPVIHPFLSLYAFIIYLRLRRSYSNAGQEVYPNSTRQFRRNRRHVRFPSIKLRLAMAFLRFHDKPIRRSAIESTKPTSAFDIDVDSSAKIWTFEGSRES